MIDLRNFKFAHIIALAISFIALPLTSVAAEPEVVVVPRLQIPVELDGVITNGEWDDAVTFQITFQFPTTQGPEERMMGIGLKHDCKNLWILFGMEDYQEDITVWPEYPSDLPDTEGDGAGIVYDVSGDLNIGLGDDAKVIFHPNFAIDAVNDILGVVDVDVGGKNNVMGASSWVSDPIPAMIYEIVHPLKSGDAPGNDLAIGPGGSIDAAFGVGEPELGPFIGPPEWYRLIITHCPVGGTIIQNSKIELLKPVLIILTIALTMILRVQRRGERAAREKSKIDV